MAIGTAALIIILSVYNGFNNIIEDNLSDLAPDILVRAVDGESFIPEGESFNLLMEDSRIESISSVLEDYVYLKYGDNQSIAKAKGVDYVYEEESALAGHVVLGEFKLHNGELPMAAVGSGLAYQMGINPRFVERMELYYPGEGRSLALLGPALSLSSVKLKASCLFSLSSDVDSELIILPLETMQELLGAEGKVSGIELRTTGTPSKTLLKELQESLGEEFEVLDRYAQSPLIHKMMRYEKFAIFAILIFVVIIIAFNIFSSLTMLIIEKKDDIGTLRAMGADEGLIKKIFILEGWLISLLGLVCGLAAGIALTLLQQETGLIKMPGGFLVQAYPVELQLSDILITTAGVAAIGYFIALLAAHRKEYGRK